MLWLVGKQAGGARGSVVKGAPRGLAARRPYCWHPYPLTKASSHRGTPTPGGAVCPYLEMCFRKVKRCCEKVLAGMAWPGSGLTGLQVGLLSELVPVLAGGLGLYSSAQSPGSWQWLASDKARLAPTR